MRSVPAGSVVVARQCLFAKSIAAPTQWHDSSVINNRQHLVGKYGETS